MWSRVNQSSKGVRRVLKRQIKFRGLLYFFWKGVGGLNQKPSMGIYGYFLEQHINFKISPFTLICEREKHDWALKCLFINCLTRNKIYLFYNTSCHKSNLYVYFLFFSYGMCLPHVGWCRFQNLGTDHISVQRQPCNRTCLELTLPWLQCLTSGIRPLGNVVYI